MRWRRGGSSINMTSHFILCFAILITGLINNCEGNRRTSHRRKDVAPESLFVPQPTAESLQMFAQATGAAGFEDFTEGKSLVKRLIPANSQPDLDVVEYQGVIGKAGVDFPALPNIPNTGFNCKNVPTGYYADLETACQVFHICDTSRKISFLCPNGTIFSQSHLICDWWFKVDCASAPALYESSVEYYSNEQKKSQKVSHSLSKNPDLQQIGTDTNVRASESRRASVNVPSTTERLLRHKQKLQIDVPPPNAKATARSYQALFDINPTQRIQATTAFEKRRKNLVQLIATNFGNPSIKTTLPTFDTTTRKPQPVNDYNNAKEMQVVAETASFVNNQNRQFLQQYNSKNLRPYAVYTPNLTVKPQKPKSTLTTLYDIQAQPVNQYVEEATTKRQTLVPYTKSYASILNEKREPYTRPGVSLLRDFLEREKNKTIQATTEKIAEVTARSDKFQNKFGQENRVTIETKNSFESVTKIPQTTRKSDNNKVETSETKNTFSTTTTTPFTKSTEESYQERRGRLIQKLDFEPIMPTEPTEPTTIPDTFYGDKTNRPGLVVPSSLTPKALHSFAIYYATALDNLSTSPPPDDIEKTTLAIDEFEPIDEGLPGLFSRQTVNKYSNLFGNNNVKGELLEEMKLDPNETYKELVEDLSLQMSQTPLATSPQIRELAQVFTHALSAYLQDPVKFRKVLSDIRPTHPSFGDMLITTEDAANTEPTTTINEDDHEILGFSDDHKESLIENSFRGSKAINIASDFTTIEEPTTTVKPVTTETTTRSYTLTTPNNPFRCCGRISASYTTAPTSTISSFKNKFDIGARTESYGTLPTNSYAEEQILHQKNNSKPTPKSLEDYSEVTDIPSGWDVELLDSTLAPITNSHQMFESKKIKPTNFILSETTPVYFTENDSIELENEEELQRAHSQSFVSPQGNNLRQGKQLKSEDKTLLKKPSEDLEAPTERSAETSTVQVTTVPSTTTGDQNEALTTITPVFNNIFTSPDNEKPFTEFQWSTPLENWQSTIIDPITLNDGLSPSGPEESISETGAWGSNTGTPLPIDFTTSNDAAVSSTISIESTTLGNNFEDRFGKLLRESTSTEPEQDLTTITDTVVEKAKEMMEGMNATTTQKLMNVMKKTKSKTVKRLILLLVQTCDDDHNKTAEASKKALLDALMAVSQKDMEEITKEDVTETPTTSADIKTTEYYRRSDRFVPEGRKGKSLNVDAQNVIAELKIVNNDAKSVNNEAKSVNNDEKSVNVETKSINVEAKAINSLSSNPSTTESKTEETETTTASYVKTTTPSRRGGKRFQARTDQPTTTTVDTPVAAARTAVQGDVKTQSDTRALELLRSLYTIAARWG